MSEFESLEMVTYSDGPPLGADEQAIYDLERKCARAAVPQPRIMWIHPDGVDDWLKNFALGPTQAREVSEALWSEGAAECNGCHLQVAKLDDGYTVQCTFPAVPAEL